MKLKINTIISDLINQKQSDRKLFISHDVYNTYIECLKHAKFVLNTQGKKNIERLICKSDKLTINKKEHLIKSIINNTVVYYVINEKLFNILY